MFNLSKRSARENREDWDRVIEKRLEDYAKDYEVEYYGTEQAMLEKQRTGEEKETITEEWLEEGRKDTSHLVTEGRLDNEDSMYNEHRVDAFTGSEVYKLEEKRLSKKPAMEDVSYESAVSDKE